MPLHEQALPLSFAATGNRRNGGAFAVAGTASQLAVTGNRNSGAFSQYRHCKAVHGREPGKVVPSQEQALQVGLWLQEYKQGCLCGSRHCKLVRGARKQKWWCLGKNRHCNGVMETGNRVSGAFTGGGKASRFAVTDSRNGGALVGAGDCKLVCGDRKQKVRCF